MNFLSVNILNLNLNFFQFKDIQWEYPGAVEYGAAVDSKQRYTSLIKVVIFSLEKLSISERGFNQFLFKSIYTKHLKMNTRLASRDIFYQHLSQATKNT